MPFLPGKHLLMTADAVGGVWDHASSLAQSMARRGWDVTFVTFGPAPRQDQFLPLLGYDNIDLEITNIDLEWQDPQGDDRQRALDHMASLEDRLNPDIVHLNGYREACAGWRAPVLVGASSCAGSWWRACRSIAPSQAGWRTYLADVAAGLAAADRWVAPTAAFRDIIEQLYTPSQPGDVIAHGIDMPFATAAKQPFILAQGRLWDEARNIGVLTQIADGLSWPVRIDGAARRDGAAPASQKGVEWLGSLPRTELSGMMVKAGIFVSPAPYDPFGTAVLEAAANACALVLADIPAYRELWEGAALFVDPRDGNQMRATLNSLSRHEAAREILQKAAQKRAAGYSITATADAYEQLYRDMLDRRTRKRPAHVAAFSEVHA
jgi:glycosyltransferase involved in cell wall biosynthesis